MIPKERVQRSSLDRKGQMMITKDTAEVRQPLAVSVYGPCSGDVLFSRILSRRVE